MGPISEVYNTSGICNVIVALRELLKQVLWIANVVGVQKERIRAEGFVNITVCMTYSQKYQFSKLKNRSGQRNGDTTSHICFN